MLIGGNKVGDDRFYEWMAPIADDIYARHVRRLAREHPAEPERPPAAGTGGKKKSKKRKKKTEAIMAKKFDQLRMKMTPDQTARVKAAKDRLRLEMNLQELRQQVADLNQAEVAEILNVTQGYVSRLERRADMTVGKLREYVRALGGEVEITAKFKGKEFVLTQLGGLEQLQELAARGQ